jgi:hypothetical protein
MSAFIAAISAAGILIVIFISPFVIITALIVPDIGYTERSAKADPALAAQTVKAAANRAILIGFIFQFITIHYQLADPAFTTSPSRRPIPIRHDFNAHTTRPSKRTLELMI